MFLLLLLLLLLLCAAAVVSIIAVTVTITIFVVAAILVVYVHLYYFNYQHSSSFQLAYKIQYTNFNLTLKIPRYRNEALHMFEKYAWDKTDFAVKEVTRYQSCPGQATGYMIGRLTILELRRKAEQELGERFNLKDFHYQVLSQGNAPLSFLRKYIAKYIECVKSEASSSLCKSIVESEKQWDDFSAGGYDKLTSKPELLLHGKHYPWNDETLSNGFDLVINIQK